jgi:hypothetical protein
MSLPDEEIDVMQELKGILGSSFFVLVNFKLDFSYSSSNYKL